MDPLIHQLLRFSQQLSTKYSDGGSPVPYLIILYTSNVDKDLSGGVVDEYGAEDGGTIVGDGDGLVVLGDALEYFVHSFGAEGGFRHVSDSDGANEGR